MSAQKIDWQHAVQVTIIWVTSALIVIAVCAGLWRVGPTIVRLVKPWIVW